MRFRSSLTARLRRWVRSTYALALAMAFFFGLATAKCAEIHRLEAEALDLRIRLAISLQRLEDMKALERRNATLDRQFRESLRNELSVIQADVDAAPCRLGYADEFTQC